MSMIDRYKKHGGFVQLLQLIETTEHAKSEKFLKMIAEENPVWEAEIRKKVLSIDRLLGWNQTYLMEVLPRLSAKVVATAVAPLPPEKQQVFLGALPFQERRKAEDVLKETRPNPGEITSCQIKILTEVRTMVQQGLMKFEKVDPDLTVPENIEDMLNNGCIPPTHAEMVAETQAAEAQGSSGGGGTPSEEMLQLRRRVMALTQENQLLKKQLQEMKDKVDQVRKAVA